MTTLLNVPAAETKICPGVNAIFDVELTERSNVNSPYPTETGNRPQGLMEEATYRKVVERAVEYGRVESFVIGGLGEPLLHPDIVRFVRIAVQAGLRPALITNGSLLSKELSEKLVDAGIKDVNLQMGGFRQEIYEYVSPGLSFKQVHLNALDFLEVASGRAHMNVLISPAEENIAEAEKIATFWRATGAKFCFYLPPGTPRGLQRPAGADGPKHAPRGCISVEEVFRPSRRDAAIMHEKASFVCYPKDKITFINHQGNYQLCCKDFGMKYPLGNVFEMSVAEAYSHKGEASRENSPLCANCNVSGDLEPRGTRFYLGAAAYVFGSALAMLDLPTCHTELLHCRRNPQ